MDKIDVFRLQNTTYRLPLELYAYTSVRVKRVEILETIKTNSSSLIKKIYGNATHPIHQVAQKYIHTQSVSVSDETEMCFRVLGRVKR